MLQEKLLWKNLNLVLALLASGIVLTVCATGVGPLPPLGPTLNPGSGIWTHVGVDNPSRRTETNGAKTGGTWKCADSLATRASGNQKKPPNVSELF